MSNQTVTITGPRTPYEKANEAKKKDSNSENIQVFVRCRPLDVSRNEKRGVVEIDRIRKEIRVNERLNSANDKQSRLFTYDGVFDFNVGQCEVYDNVVAPLIDEVLAGYNCTVFAYGQTGTGKTYTMEGERSDFECSWQDDPKAGIVPRALDQLFETLNESSGSSQVAVSYMELYNEKLYDLLNPTDDFASLSIYEDKGGKVKIGRLAQIAVTKKEEIFDILQKGSAKRQKAATKLNSCSSRSHTIFTVTIRSKDADALMSGEEIYRIGKLNLVDLAGSENIGRSGAVEKRAAEAGNINKSLLTLGRVITSLVERQNHIPYRESKLTRLLQDSLGGCTKTSIIATISPNILDVEDTLSTLDYAQRAKKIQNKPEVNQKVAKVDILRDVEEELIRMRRDLEAARCGTNAFVISKENYDSMTAQISVLGKEVEEKDVRISEIEIKISDLEAERERINSLFTETKQKLEEEANKRAETEVALQHTETELKITAQDRNEQKHLVTVHVETEQRLKSQANQLLEVAEKSVNHVAKLHEKVGRVNDLHENSVDQVENSRKSFGDRLQELKTYISENFDKNELEKIGSVTGSEFVHLTSLLSSVSSQVDQFVNCVSSGIVSLSNSVDDVQVIDKMNSVFTSTENLKTMRKSQISKVGESLEEKKQVSQELFNVYTDTFSKQRSALEDLLMSLSEQMTKLATDVADQFKAVETNVINVLDEKFRMDQVLGKDIETTQELLINSSSLRMQQLSKFKELISAMESEESKSIANVLERTKHHSAKLDESCKNINECKNKISSVVLDSNKSVGSIIKQSSTLVNRIDNVVGQHCQSNIDMASDSHSQVGEQYDSVAHSIAESDSKVTEVVQELLSSEGDAIACLKSVLDVKKNALSKLATDVKEQVAPLCEKVSETSGAVSKSQEAIDNEIYSTKLHLELAQKNVTKKFNILEEHVNSLELKKYQPTGETPQKTNFVFPTNLVCTSPHEKILQRFRDRDSAILDLAVVTELPESSGLSSSSESIDSCGTTSSCGSNIENKIPESQTEPSSKIAKLKKKVNGSKSDLTKMIKKKGVLQSTN